ncbi:MULTISPECIES: VOC family protein [Actinomadura]|uniref:Glyoxalase n=1 Tax=Actinomadura montaniterrae TaxID=1803903 RepID=A0A6L3WE41_9ACTN|nr:VOC family protein [Actinomadura montaniterrae]KAB2390286.1 glyoxalase [Actinomadura montaniterrae]
MSPTMNTIDLIVTDLEAAIAFYARLDVHFDVDPQYPDHAGCDLPGGMHLMLDTAGFRGSTTPGWTKPEGGPRNFLAFEFPAPADVDAKYAELTKAGYEGLREPWDAFWGMRYSSVLDPDGNGVDLYARLPEETVPCREET